MMQAGDYRFHFRAAMPAARDASPGPGLGPDRTRIGRIGSPPVILRRGVLALTLLLAACSAEKRPAGPDQPQSPPNGPADPRAAAFESNKYQLSQGGRYFTWYGCGSCHGGDAKGPLDLGDGQWLRGGGFDQVYRSIVEAHPGQTPGYADAIPAQQLWQITAYVRSLQDVPPDKRRRQDIDQTGEPQGSNWTGPVQ